MEKQKINYRDNNKIKNNKIKFKEKFYSMSEGNTSIAEPNIKVLRLLAGFRYGK